MSFGGQDAEADLY